MVKGIEVFRKHFAGYEDKYVLIGGTACDLLFQKNGLPFRATRDLDIILVAEALTPDFGIKFWEFIKNGQYMIQQRSDGSPIFYRFRNPQDKAFPAMLELFSRSSKELEPESAGPNLRKIPLGDEISSLSAILSPNLKVDIHGEVKNDLVEFINACKDDTIDPKALGLSGSSQSDILERIKMFYGI